MANSPATEKYKKIKQLGTGTFGTVWLVKSEINQSQCVLKEIDLSAIDRDGRQRAINEVKVLSKLKHKNIVSYKEARIDQEKKLYIFMEHADCGDLYNAIEKQNGIPFTENCVISWFIQICLALQYIHYRNILHRDLKTQNIFLTRNKVIKVGDFGISRILGNSDDLATTLIGTPYYLSPEICMKKPYNFKSDMWALGCVLFEISALDHPFKASNFTELLYSIRKSKRRDFPSWCGTIVQEIVNDLLNVDPVKRPSTDEVLAYPSLQPYLSKYVFHHVSPTKNFLVDTKNLPITESLKQSKTNILKRTASISMLIPQKFGKLAAPESLVIHRPRSTSNASPKILKSEISQKVRSISQKPHSNKTELLDSKNMFTLNTTYLLPEKTYNKSNRSKPSIKISIEDTSGNNDIDIGYQSEEVASCSSEEKSNNETNWKASIQYKNISPLNKITTTVNFCNTESSSSDSFCEDSHSESSQNSSVLEHSNCQHSLCHQCILTTLWKNRIRGSPDTDEYFRLKTKLLGIFKGQLFDKVYNSLLYDWEGNEIGKSRTSILSFVKTLNCEQVQNLPLMMQLIQIEIQIKTLGERNVYPSVRL